MLQNNIVIPSTSLISKEARTTMETKMAYSFKRIQSLDILKGLVIILMALDHTRDYFHDASFFIDPTDPTATNLPLFFTRFITHYCAPVFCFLAGISAFLVGQKKTKKELSQFLLKRGIWLILIEVTIVKFAWRFQVDYSFVALLVIWSLGISMVFLAGIIHAPRRAILMFSCLLIFGHNLFDNFSFDGNILWALLHERTAFIFENGFKLRVVYPLIPWIGVMSLGYYFGGFYKKSYDRKKRVKLLKTLGLSAIAMFFVVRLFNQYGNPNHWEVYDYFSQTIFSFFNVKKYPPSLAFLLVTLGPALVFLALTDNTKNKISEFLSVFGRVPFFFYIIHIYVIHFFAMLLAEVTGFGWESMILETFVSFSPDLKGYGVGLLMTYIIWALIVLLHYPICKWFGEYKMNNKDKRWLSYL